MLTFQKDISQRKETHQNELFAQSPSRQAFDQLVQHLRSSPPTKETIWTHQRTMDFLNETILTETFLTEAFLDEIRRLNFDWIHLKSSLFVSPTQPRTFVPLNYPRQKSKGDEQIDVETWNSFANTYISLLDRFTQLDHRWTMMYKDKFSFPLNEFQEKIRVMFIDVVSSLPLDICLGFFLFIRQDFHQRLEQIDEILPSFTDQMQSLIDHLPSLTAHKMQCLHSIILEHKTLFDDYFTQLRHRYELNVKIDEIRHDLETNENVEQIEQLLRSIDQLNRDECSSTILEQYSFYHQLMEWENYVSAIEKNFAVIEDNSQTNSLGLIEIQRTLRSTIDDLQQREEKWKEFVQTHDEHQRCRELDQRWTEIRTLFIDKEKFVIERIQLWSNYDNARQSYSRRRVRFSADDGSDERQRLFDEIHQMYQTLLRHSDISTRLTLEKDWNDFQLNSSSSSSSSSSVSSSRIDGIDDGCRFRIERRR